MDFENAESYAPNKSIQQQQHQQQQQQQQQQSITASSAAEFSSTQTLLPPNVQIKRKKRPNFSGLRTIQVHRGPKGFGFTLCGNAPCCLDCVVKGSQAEAAGLFAGQYIMTINGENVSTSSIEQVIQLIMSCRGTLTLNVARDEDDDSVVSQANVRVKPRSRPRSSLMSNLPQTQTTESHAGQNPAQSTKQLDQSSIERATAEILQTDAFNSFFNSGSMESSAGTSERSQKNSLSSLPSSLNGHANSGTSGGGTMSSFESLEAPGKSTTSVSTARTQNNLQNETRKTSQTSLQANWERDVPVNGESKSSLKNLNNSDDICSAAETGRFYAVVGYIGTIDIPPQLQGHQTSMLAFLQSSIGKMQSEQKTTFMLLLEIGEKHVRLINAKNVTVTCIELDAILCCFGTAGETKHCFAILAQTSPSPLHSPAGSSNQSTGTPLISCMLLSVDPQIAQHSVHLKAAKKFTIACSRITSSLCKEFPLNCGEIVNRIQGKVTSNPAKNYLSELNPNKAETFCRRTSGNRNSAVVACTDKACDICAGHTMTMNSNAFNVMKQNPRSVLNHSVKQQIIRAQTPVEVVATVAPNQPRQSAQPFSSLETPTHRQSEHRTSTLPPSTGMTSKSQHVHDFVYGATTSSHRCPSEVEEVDRGQSLQSGGGGYWPRIGSWAASFDNLLQDPIGVEIFSQFLKKEFAEENIIFYQFCQQFKKLVDTLQMNELAMQIFNQHLATGCPHPVNVDNQVLMSVCEKLSSNVITKDLFDDAQLQIYKLMKFDPYSRFLKSEAYINCVKTGNPFAQGKAAVVVEPKKLITAGNQSMASSDATSEDSNQPDNKKHNNLFQSKKSILPWKRKPKLSSNDMSSDSSMKSLEKSKGISQSSDSLLLSVPSSTTLECQTQCRVYLPNGCHVTMDCARRESVGSAVAALCNDYNLKMKCLEIVDGEHKAINSGETIANYGGREIYLERRVYFRVELPSSQNIGVKSKPNISIKDVFQPLLVKYCLSLNNLVLRLHDSSSPLNLQLAVAVLDSKKVVAETIEQYTLHTSEKENRYQQAPTQVQQMGHQRRTEPRQLQVRRQSDQPANIMSHHQLYQNQGQVQGNQITAHNSRQHSQGPKVCRNLGSNSQGRPQAAVAPSQRTIRPSNEEHNVYSSHETDGHHHNHETTSLSNQTDLNPEHGHLFGLLAKVQGSRMDNQRGIMSVSKLEMPSFLEPKQSGGPILHSTPEKYGNSCCPSASCLHLLQETPLQSTMIQPPQKELQGGGGGVYRKPPSGKHRRGSNFSDQRRPLIDSQMVDGMSRRNPRSLSKMITPIPGHVDNYYYISDDSAFDINPSQLPSPSSQMYPMSSAVPTNSEVSSRHPQDTFTSSVYEEDIYQDNGMRRPNTTKVSSMTRSNSTDWLEKSSGSYECRRGAADYPDHFTAGGQSSLYPSGPEASTFSSSSTSNHRQASNLHYPSTASNQSWQSNPVQVAPQNIDDRQEMNSQRPDHLMNDQQHSLGAQPPKIYHV